MISPATRSFWQAYEGLNATQKGGTARLYSVLAGSRTQFASIQKLRGYPDYWSVRGSRDVRVVGKRHGDTPAWIGTHNEFDKLLS